MPTQIKNQQVTQRERVDAYHRDLKYAISLAGSWDEDTEVQEFLDQDSGTWEEPSGYMDFREALCTAEYSGSLVGLRQSSTRTQQKKLAQKLRSSVVRRRFYRQYLNGKLGCASSEEVQPVSFDELEQRYQYYLYKKDRKNRGLGQGPVFGKWLLEVSADPGYPRD